MQAKQAREMNGVETDVACDVGHAWGVVDVFEQATCCGKTFVVNRTLAVVRGTCVGCGHGGREACCQSSERGVVIAPMAKRVVQGQGASDGRAVRKPAAAAMDMDRVLGGEGRA